MNFLAHAFLAGDNEADQIGGLMGDFVKGPLPGGLPADLASGVALHRAIDSFADRHEAFRASRARISPARRRVGGILVDLFYDHLLARDWSAYRPDKMLEEYTRDLYASLDGQMDFLPDGARQVATLMRAHNWLCAYRDIDAIGRTIERMAIHRFRRENPLPGGLEELIENAEGIESDFMRFLPDALAFSGAWRASRRDGIVEGAVDGTVNGAVDGAPTV